MIIPKRPQVLADPLADTELELIEPPAGGVEDFDITPNLKASDLKGAEAATQGWGLNQWQQWGVAGFGSATVGEYVYQLGEEQRKLLWVALLHALEPAHQGHVTLRKRVYAGGRGLEVIDQGIDQAGAKGNPVLPLVIVFVEPPRHKP